MTDQTSPRIYHRPLLSEDGLTLAGGWARFDRVEVLSRTAPPRVIPADQTPEAVLSRLTTPRAEMAGLSFAAPSLMGVLNVTPDSFSDGGRHTDASVERAQALRAEGAAIIDIGGESTRPGATPVLVEEEIARILPVVTGAEGPISIDTRNGATARAALRAGADLFNDVSALTHDAGSLGVAVETGAPVCLMYAQGDPATMQRAPHYDDVLLDVYDFLDGRIAACEAAGIPRTRIMVDPGIGFGKTLHHNLTLIRGITLFHGLGCPILIGVSRKGFIGRLSGETHAAARAPGSIAAGLAAVGQGAQVLRVHDVAETAQALAVWSGLTKGVET